MITEVRKVKSEEEIRNKQEKKFIFYVEEGVVYSKARTEMEAREKAKQKVELKRKD